MLRGMSQQEQKEYGRLMWERQGGEGTGSLYGQYGTHHTSMVDMCLVKVGDLLCNLTSGSLWFEPPESQPQLGL